MFKHILRKGQDQLILLGMVEETYSRRSSPRIFRVLRRKLRRLCLRIRWLIRRRPKLKIVVKRLRKLGSKTNQDREVGITNEPSFRLDGHSIPERPIRIASFNVAMFSLAPAIPNRRKTGMLDQHEDQDPLTFTFKGNVGENGDSYRPKSILKQSPLHPTMSSPGKSKLKVSINLPDNEISLANNKFLNFVGDDQRGSAIMITGNNNGNQVPVRSPVCFPYMFGHSRSDQESAWRSSKSILEVLREVNADILALQDVKAEEEKGMRPLSDLAKALGMYYVFAESWAPEYGNAVLSRWPIKRWRVQKIADEDDFRNVLKATIDVPRTGELNFNCTQLDHLDEHWRMRQIRAIVQSYDPPDILAGGLNSLDESDYSLERWMDIVKYYQDIGKPTPKTEVIRFLKGREFTDAKEFSGDCEPVVIIAKGQNVQGTCKYGTRVDYILAAPESPYMFVPNSYSVISSKGTSDHHIVKADIVKVNVHSRNDSNERPRKPKHNVVRMTCPSFSKGIWQVNS